jgi:ATP-binding cassette subfamily G (WHITE) protein 2 (SNQ2)
LTIRQAQIFWGDKFGIFSRYFSVLVQALIVGSVFYNMPLTAAGAFSRGGAFFVNLVLTLLVCILSALVFFSAPLSISSLHSFRLKYCYSFHSQNFLGHLLVAALFRNKNLMQCITHLRITLHRYIRALMGMRKLIFSFQILIDIPIYFLQALIWVVITYWMFGLDSDAGKFFVNLFVNVVASLAITNLLRY